MKLPAGKVIVTAALNGAFVTKDVNPNVPEQPDEIARAARECADAGAAIVHIHARDEQGRPCGTREKFAEILAAVRGACPDVIVHFSTGGGTNLTIEERVSCLDADPEMASLNMGTLMRQSGPNAGEPFVNMTADIEAWAAKMKAMRIKPEMECYSQSMYRDVRNLIAQGPRRAALLRQLRARHEAPGRRRGDARHARCRCTSSSPRAATSTSPPPAPPSCPSPPWGWSWAAPSASASRTTSTTARVNRPAATRSWSSEPSASPGSSPSSRPRRTRPERSSAS